MNTEPSERRNTPDSKQEALKPCPFCGVVPSPYPTAKLPANLHEQAGEWVQIVHSSTCFIALLGFDNYPIHRERWKAWNSRASVAAVEGDAKKTGEVLAKQIIDSCLCAEPSANCEESAALHLPDLMRSIAALPSPQYDALCERHRNEFTTFHVGGCIECWKENEVAPASSSLPAEPPPTCGPARPEDGSECLYGVCPRPRDGCSEYCWQHHKTQCVPAEPLQPKSNMVRGWITGNQYRERGRYEGGKGESGEPWYISDSGMHWSAFDVQFFPDHEFHGVLHRNDPNLLLCDFVFHNRRCDSTKEWHDRVNAELVAPPLQPTGEQENNEVVHPCVVDWKTLIACLNTAEQVFRRPDLTERLERFRRTRAKLIAQARSTPPTTPSDAAMRAAEEIVKAIPRLQWARDINAAEEVAAIITRHLAATEQENQ